MADPMTRRESVNFPVSILKTIFGGGGGGLMSNENLMKMILSFLPEGGKNRESGKVFGLFEMSPVLMRPRWEMKINLVQSR